MTSRDRLLAAIDHGKPDRVPLDIWAVPEVWDKLRAQLGVETQEQVQELLHIDTFLGVGPDYIGPPVPDLGPDMSQDMWGMRTRRLAYATGTYFEQCHWPLANAKTPADLEEYNWPSVDWFDFSTVREQCEAARAADRATTGGYYAAFYQYNMVRGLEQSLMDLALDPDLAHAIVDRICEFQYAHAERLYEAGGGLIDSGHLTDDFGTQTGLMISPSTFDEFFQPHFRRMGKLMHQHGVRVFHHDDGAMWELLPRLIEAGIDILNPVQYRCGDVDLDWLKDTYGQRLCFHGGVDNQYVLPFGTVEEVVAEVRKCLSTLGRDGGYILAPCHNLQAVTPVENILAMYETALEEGVY